VDEFSLVGGQQSTNWVLCTIQKKGSESTSEVKRRFEDGSQQRKWIYCDIAECDGPQAKLIPTETEFTPSSQNLMDIVEEYNTQTIDLETHMGCLPTSNNSDFQFDLKKPLCTVYRKRVEICRLVHG